MADYRLICGDALEVLRERKSDSIQCCISSPPYYKLRDYEVEGQIGLESTPEQFIENLVEIFREVKRILRPDGTLWLNLGDRFNGSGGAGGDYRPGGLKEGQPKYPGTKIANLKPKDLIGIPWMAAFALRADGWFLRSDIVWAKPAPMPESVRDRPTRSHEYIFLLSRSQKYFYDGEAIKEPSVTRDNYKRDRDSTKMNNTPGRTRMSGLKENNYAQRNKRDVWFVTGSSYRKAHFATFPPALIEPCVLAGSREGDIILDPFCGSGTTGVVALKHKRRFIGIDLKPEYIDMTEERIQEEIYGSTRN